MENNQNMQALNERKNLHEMANVLTIAQGKLQLLLRSMQQNPSALSTAEIHDKLDQILSTMNRLGDLLHLRREEITRSDSQGSKG